MERKRERERGVGGRDGAFSTNAIPSHTVDLDHTYVIHCTYIHAFIFTHTQT